MQQTSVTHVAQLDEVAPEELSSAFGAATAAFLTTLLIGGPWEEVRERGPPKSITCERSFPPAKSDEAVRDAPCYTGGRAVGPPSAGVAHALLLMSH